jgi:tRNA threonylcarbamoyladenosine biosynthesis protein TsaE
MALGGAIARHARAGDVVALVGELGAGKTQLVRGMAAALGLAPGATASPTFVMMQEYRGAAGRGEKVEPKQVESGEGEGAGGGGELWLVHMDAYRVQSAEDLESIGWDSRPDGEVRRGAVVAVEWADRLGGALGADVLEVALTHAGPEERELVMVPRGRWVRRWPALVRELDRALAPPRVCPLCRALVEEGGAYAPFCSARCRMADLGRWLGGRYVVSRPLDQADLEES